MFRFILPRLDGTLYDFAIGAADLPAAFERFARDWWRPEMTGSFGVWKNHALVARVLLGRDNESGDLVPYLLHFDPPRQQSLACGD